MNTSQNNTEITGIWTATPRCALAALFTSLLLNSFALFLFLRHRHLRTSFNVYLINLLSSNLLYTVFSDPFVVMTIVSHGQWRLGPTACSFHLYTGWIFQAALAHGHMLISLNRLWAVAWPISYWNHHSKRMAVCTVVATWAYLLAFLLPGLVEDSQLSNRSTWTWGNDQCWVEVERQVQWEIAEQTVVYDLPILVVVLAYPVICVKTAAGMTRKRKVLASAVLPRVGQALPRTVEAFTAETPPRTFRNPPSRGLYGSQAQSLRLVSLMTFCVALCYLPEQLLFTFAIWTDRYWEAWNGVSRVLYMFATVLDPVFLILSTGELRRIVTNLFSRCSSCRWAGSFLSFMQQSPNPLGSIEP